MTLTAPTTTPALEQNEREVNSTAPHIRLLSWLGLKTAPWAGYPRTPDDVGQVVVILRMKSLRPRRRDFRLPTCTKRLALTAGGALALAWGFSAIWEATHALPFWVATVICVFIAYGLGAVLMVGRELTLLVRPWAFVRSGLADSARRDLLVVEALVRSCNELTLKTVVARWEDRIRRLDKLVPVLLGLMGALSAVRQYGLGDAAAFKWIENISIAEAGQWGSAYLFLLTVMGINPLKEELAALKVAAEIRAKRPLTAHQAKYP